MVKPSSQANSRTLQKHLEFLNSLYSYINAISVISRESL